MKNLILTTLICLFVPFSLLAEPLNGASAERDSSKNNDKQPALSVKGTQVYQGSTLLTKDQVLSILSTNAKAASLYEKGKNLRGTGGVLIVGGILSMTGGIVMMVNGIKTVNEDSGYLSYSYTDFTDKYYFGLAITTIGELMLDGGIACTIVGKIQIKRSIRNYNAGLLSSLHKPGEVNYQLGMLDNGHFGLRLSF